MGVGDLPEQSSQTSDLASPRKAHKHLLPEKSSTKSETCLLMGWEQGSLWSLLVNTVMRGQLGSGSWEGCEPRDSQDPSLGKLLPAETNPATREL